MIRFFLLIVWQLILAVSLIAQEEFHHPELEWNTITTEHFLVHYHDGAKRTAQEVSRIAEQIYAPITELYQHKPDQRVSFVIRDYDDYSNGAAYFYDNRIDIWAPALDFELRGTHPWLLNVVTHEFTHIVQIQTAMKMGRRVPAVYFQWLGYEAERRPDVLYGYPNVLVSYPLSGFVVPSWFAEGVAQFNRPELGYDYWDSHRDMILRMYTLDGNPLSWEEMAVFGKNSLGNESSYNAGFSLVEYIANTYGVEKLRDISRSLSSATRLTIDGAVQAAIGKSGEELYREWNEKKTQVYQAVAESIRSARSEGGIIEAEGFGNFYPAFSPDGSKIAYISNKGEDYFSASSVYLYDLNTKQSTKVTSKVRSSLSFSPDGRYLYYSKITRENPHWSALSDVYRYDLKTENEERLTNRLRASNPKLSPDGKKLVFVCGGDGTLNIGVSDADGKNARRLTQFDNGEQVYTPTWSPDGATIALGYSVSHNQSMALVNTDGSDFRVLVDEKDSRNPCFSHDGKTLYFSWDKTGIFNIYGLDLQTGERRQVTNVLGGAFLPAVNQNGDLAFATYLSTGYKIAFTRSGLTPVKETPPIIASLEKDSPERGAGQQSIRVRASGSSSREEKIAPQDTTRRDPKPYRSVFSSVSFIPLVRFDNYNELNSGIDIVKPGLYVISNEVLDKLSLFAGAAINRKLERDLFLQFEYRERLPLLYQLGLEPVATLELYNITRTTSFSFPLFVDREYTMSADVTYNLFEFDVTLRQKIFNERTDLKLGYALSRYSADLGSFFIPTVGVSSSFHNLYLIGNTLSTQFSHNGILPSVDRDINPVGRSISFRYSLELNKYNKDLEYDFSNGVLIPRYKNVDFHRLELTWNEHLELPFQKHTLSFSIRRGTILGTVADTIFHFYAGGFIGMKGYPFYAIEGNDLATFNVTYRFPLWTTIDFRFLQFYFTKLYGSVFGDVGNAWNGPLPALARWRTDAGFELRLESFSFYVYPTRIFFSGAYGFDQFIRMFNNVSVTYGREWRFYLGILFNFELNELAESRRVL